MIRPLLSQLRRAEQGATIVEFALIAPTLLVVLLGLFDLAHSMFTVQMLQGAIQDAARDSTIEGAASEEATLDANVSRAVRAVAPRAALAFSRKSYTDFTGVNRPEDYDDVNANNTCDAGEPFEDANGNASWDLDPGKAGFGAARDATLYSVTVTYPRYFPVYALIPGQSEDLTLIANTVLRNQPYGARITQTVSTGTCT